MTKPERSPNQISRAKIWLPIGGGWQTVSKDGSRRREEADFLRKNNSASLPRRLRLLRRFLNWPSGVWNVVQLFNLCYGGALSCLAMRNSNSFRRALFLLHR